MKCPVINTEHVIEALENGKIGYLGLDVYEREKGIFFFTIILTKNKRWGVENTDELFKCYYHTSSGLCH